MHEINDFNLSTLSVETEPFPHFYARSVLPISLHNQVYAWLNSTDYWNLTREDFYEQYEYNLLRVNIPDQLRFLIKKKTIENITHWFKEIFTLKTLDLVGIMAHKLTDGQRIGIHNDFIHEEETHRLVLHFNPGWQEDNGGFLMLFNSSNAEDVSRVISPVANSAFGFEISDRSHHAVSRIYNFTRYTIVYTFRIM